MTEDNVRPWKWAAILVIVGAALSWGILLARYPSFLEDEAFFVYPAIRAATGGPFAYAVSQAAPFGQQLWAYHGPLWPTLLELEFKFLPFKLFLARLPNFAAAWGAILLLVFWMNKRGYAYAGMVLAVLWCGDRAPLEVLFARMDGLALLFLVFAFLGLEHALRAGSRRSVTIAGLSAGLAVLTHPSCAAVVVAACFVLVLLGRLIFLGWFALGVSACLPVLVALWRGKVRASVAQLSWHLSESNEQHRLVHGGFLHLLSKLHWSAVWVVGLVLALLPLFVWAVWTWHRKRGRPGEMETAILLASSFGVATVQNLLRVQAEPPYLVLYTVWPILCLALLFETRRGTLRNFLSAICFLFWMPSLAWSATRAREAILYYPELSHAFVDAELLAVVPRTAELVATPGVYSLPMEDTYPHYALTTWMPEHEEIASDTYLVMTKAEYVAASFVSRDNLEGRSLLYDGPAFPHSGLLQYPIVILSTRH